MPAVLPRVPPVSCRSAAFRASKDAHILVSPAVHANGGEGLTPSLLIFHLVVRIIIFAHASSTDEISDRAWAALAPHLAGKTGSVGRTGADNRLFLNSGEEAGAEPI